MNRSQLTITGVTTPEQCRLAGLQAALGLRMAGDAVVRCVVGGTTVYRGRLIDLATSLIDEGVIRVPLASVWPRRGRLPPSPPSLN